METLEEKEQNLRRVLAAYGKIAIAFSGGVDSTLLLKIAHEVLGDQVIALSCQIAMSPRDEILRAHRFCDDSGIQYFICSPDVLSIDGVRANDQDRCYYCKRALFCSMIDVAKEQGFSIIADGTNVDDLSDYRPGRRALIELNVRSPLLEAGFTKQDIRDLSRKLGLPTWNMQSNACLATRVPFGERLSVELLSRIDSAEQQLHALGFTQVRVRAHGPVARIEVDPLEFGLLVSEPLKSKIVQAIKACGFTFTSVDLEGFRSGSLNRLVDEELFHG